MMVAGLLAGLSMAVPVSVPEVELAPGAAAPSSIERHELFERDRRWVPGDVGTTQFRVRNRGPSVASMWIALRSSGPDGLLDQAEVVLDTRVEEGPWVPLDPGGSRVPIPRADVEAGEARTVTIRARFAPAAGNDTQRAHAPLPLFVGLTGADGTDTPQHGGLPAAGSLVRAALVGVAVVLLMGGVLMRHQMRRRRHG